MGVQCVGRGRLDGDDAECALSRPAFLPVAGYAWRLLQFAFPVQPQARKEGIPRLPCFFDDLLPYVGGQGTIRRVLLELGAQSFVGRHGFTLEEGLPAPILDGIPEGSAAIPDCFEYLLLLLAGQNPDNVCSPHASILAQLAAAFILTLSRVGPSPGGSVISPL
ncbi:hypothetical protein AN618_07160 [Fervidicola ferrireducens]|uniref:Uncharacterized protein n=1 Tax=Fervidicola ferrireducens TaxID=520764 RepID=A0A140LC22_9FIRM|nr:hypothetical protein AN618_07160 [Fervidicola ferrireducens]